MPTAGAAKGLPNQNVKKIKKITKHFIDIMVSNVLGDFSNSQILPLKWLMIIHWNLGKQN